MPVTAPRSELAGGTPDVWAHRMQEPYRSGTSFCTVNRDTLLQTPAADPLGL